MKGDNNSNTKSIRAQKIADAFKKSDDNTQETNLDIADKLVLDKMVSKKQDLMILGEAGFDITSQATAAMKNKRIVDVFAQNKEAMIELNEAGFSYEKQAEVALRRDYGNRDFSFRDTRGLY